MITKSKVLVIVSCIFLIGVNIFALAQDQNKKCIQNIPASKESGVIHDCLDLSNQNLSSMPNLSSYKIKKLNLSHNKIIDFNTDYLPQHLEELDLSYNYLKTFNLSINNDVHDLKSISKLNLSNNQINKCSIDYLPNLKILVVNHNKLTYLTFGSYYLDLLDISENTELSNIVYFDPKKIKTIKRENIASNDPLVYFIYTYEFQ